MSEYPDHLNPFNNKKNKFSRTLSKSFRQLKGFISYQSFRRKKPRITGTEDFENVELRKNQDFSSLRNNVMSLPSAAVPTTTAQYNSLTLTSPALPRSRFKERLSRTSLNNTYDERCNPFSEFDENGMNPFDEPPIPYRRRKSKKKAPLPPNSISNPDINLDHPTKFKGLSEWSLASSETDYTVDDKSDDYSTDLNYSHSLRDCLDNFNKEMDTLNKETIEEFDCNGTQLINDDSNNSDDNREINNNESDSRNAENTDVVDVEHHQINQGIKEDSIDDEETEKIDKVVPDPDSTKNSNNEELNQTIQIDENQLEYIDAEYYTDQNQCSNDNHSNSVIKSRKYKLDKDVLLGERNINNNELEIY